MAEIRQQMGSGPVYISFDIDGLDPAFAPGTGMTLVVCPCLPGRGDSHMKGAGMLVVLLRGVNFGFWSHLGSSGKKAIVFSREGLV